MEPHDCTGPSGEFVDSVGGTCTICGATYEVKVVQSSGDSLSPASRHFLRLCLQGQRNGCSGGERAARQLAISMCRHAAGLDDSAIAGAIEFLKVASIDRRIAKMTIGYHGS